MRVLIVDALGAGRGERKATVDVIGAGPRTVAGVLESRGISVDFATAKQVLSLDKPLSGYDALLVSGMVSDVPAVSSVSKLWRKVSDGPLIVGGPLAADFHQLRRRVSYEVAVVGEGEQTLEELVSSGFLKGEAGVEELSKIRGIVYSIEGRHAFTGLRPVMPPEMFRRYKPSTQIVSKYPLYRACRVYVEVVRGCSNYLRTKIELPDGRRCIDCLRCREGDLEERYYCPADIPPGCGYCSVPSLFGPSRSKPTDLVVEEVEGLVEEGVCRVVLSASDFLDYGRDWLVAPKPLTNPREPPANLEAIEDLLSSLAGIDKVSSGKAVVMVENLKPCLVTEEVARVLGKYLRDTPVHIGCETASRELCEAIGRPSTPEEAVRAVKLLRKHGLRPYLYFIHGLPGETVEDLVETAGFVRSLSGAGVEKVTVYRFTPLPMSAFGDFPKAPPAHQRAGARELVEAAKEVNKLSKKELLGREIEVVLAEEKREFWIAYPLKHGPVVYVKGVSRASSGDRALVRVTRVVSDRAVEAKLAHLR